MGSPAAFLTELLRSMGVLAMFLLVGIFLRAKVKPFRDVFLPASVIGGFIGLLLGPQVWGEHHPLQFLQVTTDWINTWSLLPGILIIPVFASVPLGMFTNKKKDATGFSPRKRSGYILIAAGLFSAVGVLQNIIGYSTNLVYSSVTGNEVHRTFGYEMSQGFAGGHGTAGAVGAILRGFGEPFWELGQGITTTTATIGLIGGMIIGIMLINIAARKGKTTILKDPREVPFELKQGYTKDTSKHASLGRETFFSSSIETITLHLAFIFLAVGGGYYLRGALVKTGIRAFTSLPVWFYALFAMIALDFLLAKLKLNWMVDSKVRLKITGTMSDIAIVAAIASVPIQAVLSLIVPIIIMCALGFIFSYLFIFKIYTYFYKGNAPFEHAIICWGTATGVLINGMMLLKICDPDFETPALVNFSLGFSTMGVLGIFFSLYTMPILQFGSTMDLLVKSSVLMFFVHMAIACLGLFMTKDIKAKGAAI